ncbi:immunoglobulin-like domain-containing protein [Paenibacillus thermotolerans]|uniref:immunoglobulin-like domain-containing protein n=1 Tax=Paenibacillus thermotolerans TaxID=3027807 RepID=UPI002368CE0F|nr:MULTISPECIES: immunoglobulin-like domain-containing protein [unclassified Paenibacillus]
MKQYKIGDGVWQDYSDPIELSNNTVVYARSFDAAGNESETTSHAINNIDKVAPLITLNGESELEHEAGTPYTDAGAIAQDDIDGDLTNQISVTGSVFTEQLGSYVIRYNVSDSTGNSAEEQTRTVHVVDTTRPIITLLGDNQYVISQGGAFTDPGATASDNFDGDLTDRIVITGEVDSTKPGTYVLRYSVSDGSGNAADRVERVIRVLSNDASLRQVTVNAGTLSPIYSPEIFEYEMNVSNSTSNLIATIQVNEVNAKIKVNNQSKTLDDSGLAQVDLTLNVGRNSFVLEVTAQDGTVKSYTLIVNRVAGNTSPPTQPTQPIQPQAPVAPDTKSTSVEVLVNGKVENAGTARTEEVNGQRVSTIAVDEEKLKQRLEAEGERAVITIPVNTGSDIVVGELNGRMVKNMESHKAVVEIRTEKATYTLPAEQINIDAVSDRFGADLALQDIKIKIEIAEPTTETIRVVEDAAKRSEFTLVIPPLNFKVSAVYDGRTEEISKFNAYVERTIAIPEGIDPNRITTGVVVEPDGTVRHVPTKIIVINGAYYAQINSLTNSTYSVVWHPEEFEDVSNHWAKDAVNNMGSRMVINGTGVGIFDPDRNITRAEFAAIMVRGLGLRLEKGLASFTDLNPRDWYYDAVQTAYSYGLVNGFEDGSFRPNDQITREQAMVIIAKAMKLTGLEGVNSNQASNLLSIYQDASFVSGWAINGVADSVHTGIVTGRDRDKLAPNALITRAEVAMMIQRLLQKSDLI